MRFRADPLRCAILFPRLPLFHPPKRKKLIASTLDTALGSAETRLALLKVIAENSFDSILITDAPPKGSIIF